MLTFGTKMLTFGNKMLTLKMLTSRQFVLHDVLQNVNIANVILRNVNVNKFYHGTLQVSTDLSRI
jgi:hypothetical protein